MQASVQTIVDTLTTAILERRLKPGLQMVESKLVQHFLVPAAQVQQALQHLEQHKLVTIDAQHGVCIATPSLHEAREVFEVRRILEAEVVRMFVQQMDAAQIRTLRNLLAKERELVTKSATTGRLELQGDFHLTLVQLLGNQVLEQMLRTLINRCALIAMMYQTVHDEPASNREHFKILEAMTAKKQAEAVELMEEHLFNEMGKLALHQPTESFDHTQVFESSFMGTMQATIDT